MSKLAILSNVNTIPLSKSFGTRMETYQNQGYGNMEEELLNPVSPFHVFGADTVVIWADISELTGYTDDTTLACKRIDSWFQTVEGAIATDVLYFVADVDVRAIDRLINADKTYGKKLEMYWDGHLEWLTAKHRNVYRLPYKELVTNMGREQFYSDTMWYLGKIAQSNAGLKAMEASIEHYLHMAQRTPKKVLVLDLDNTLWGGIAGENDTTPIFLSDEKKGLSYKNLQRVIQKMQRTGVILAIDSKNNPEDALEIIKNHPHMILRKQDFASIRINWEPKSGNLEQIAQELNLGLDSFVFFDDNPAERELIKTMLPQVVVPDFPDKAENLAGVMTQIYENYFEKLAVTIEDLDKTRQYASNAKRNEMEKTAVDYSTFLKQLEIKVETRDALLNEERFYQLINKTNQFNLTTLRYDRTMVQHILESDKKVAYLFQVADRFGDNGIVGALVVDLEKKIPRIENFVLSCRVMGKQIENYIIDYVEKDLMQKGYEFLIGDYSPTAKNMPVAKLYTTLGYTEVETTEMKTLESGNIEYHQYKIDLKNRPVREYYVN